MQPEPTLLTTTQAVAYLANRGLSVSDETMRRWAVAGRVRHVKLPNRQVRFTEDDLDAVLVTVEPTNEVAS